MDYRRLNADTKASRLRYRFERPDELSKKLEEVADHTPALSVKHGWTGNKRALTLTLENGVGGVGSVGGNNGCECGGRGCILCLTQELPFEAT